MRDAIAAGKTTAIFYAGSTEQGGPHLALGKHTFVAHYVARRVAEQLGDALIYPVLPFAPTGDPVARTGHMRFPGSVSVSEETFARVAREVALSAIAAGFKTVVLVADHGNGQRALSRVASQLDAAWKGRGAHVYYIGDAYYKEKAESRRYLSSHHRPLDEHAGLDDTSELMFVDPDRRWVRQARIAGSDTSAGVRGDPTGASAALGETFVNWKIAAAVAQIRRLREGAPGPR